MQDIDTSNRQCILQQHVSSEPWKAIKESTILSGNVQADLLGHMKFLFGTLEAKTSFTHVYGHMDNLLEWDNMTTEQQLNICMDKEEENAFEKAVKNNEYILRRHIFTDAFKWNVEYKKWLHLQRKQNTNERVDRQQSHCIMRKALLMKVILI